MVRLAEKVKKGEKVRNICQKVVQLAEKGEKGDKVKKGENKLKIFGLFIYMDLFYINIFWNYLVILKRWKP